MHAHHAEVTSLVLQLLRIGSSTHKQQDRGGGGVEEKLRRVQQRFNEYDWIHS